MERGGNCGADGGEAGLGVTDEANASGGAGSGFAGGGGTGALSGCEVKLKPRPRSANGPETSAATSTFFTARRASSAGLMRVRISFNGRLTSLLSSSPPEFTNASGASWRSSPKEIFTAPNANWLITISACRRRVKPAGGEDISFARKSSGRAAATVASGNSISSGLAARSARKISASWCRRAELPAQRGRRRRRCRRGGGHGPGRFAVVQMPHQAAQETCKFGFNRDCHDIFSFYFASLWPAQNPF